MKQKLILTDVDGVLLDWNSAFDQYMRDRGFVEDDSQTNRYSLYKRYNIDKLEMNNIIEAFNNSDIVMGLNPLADSVKYIKQLSNYGFTFVAITSLSDTPLAYKNRCHNLNIAFNDVIFEEIICLPIGCGKYSILERWENCGLFWVEDKFSIALDGHSLGLT
jgi:FMN phosphatase YigB (HAD superfamily)